VEITSVNNDLVKETTKLQQRKFRDERGLFLLEGFKAIEEWHALGQKFENVFVLKGKEARYHFVTENLITTTEAILKKISTTDSAPEAVGVARVKNFDINILKNAHKVLLLEGIKDAGNLGTILRSATAFDVDAVILYGNCVDIYNPKCVRSSVGNLTKTPVFHITDTDELNRHFTNFERIATLPRAKSMLKNFSPKEPFLVMFGSEADGLSQELIDFSTTSVKIEMSEKVESLNLSISCGIILYKFMA